MTDIELKEYYGSGEWKETQFKHVSDEEIKRYLATENWLKLTSVQRRELAQEIELREAKRTGRDPILVVNDSTKNANSNALGDNAGMDIVLKVDSSGKPHYEPGFYALRLNPRYFEAPRDENDRTVFNQAALLEVLFHEGRHAYQRYVTDHPGKCMEEEEKTRLWKENFNSYVSGQGDRAFTVYAWQPIERDARHYGRVMARRWCESIEALIGYPDHALEQGLYVQKCIAESEREMLDKMLISDYVKVLQQMLTVQRKQLSESYRSNLMNELERYVSEMDNTNDGLGAYTEERIAACLEELTPMQKAAQGITDTAVIEKILESMAKLFGNLGSDAEESDDLEEGCDSDEEDDFALSDTEPEAENNLGIKDRI